MNLLKTAGELAQEGVTRIRRCSWDDWSYIELNTETEGNLLIRPWVKIYTVIDYLSLRKKPTELLSFNCQLDHPIWVEWKDPGMPPGFEAQRRKVNQ